MKIKYNPISSKFLILIIIISVLISCSGNSKDLPSEATFKDNIYNNKFFRFQFTLPEGWHIANKETMDSISETGKEIIAGDDENLEKSIEVAQKNIYNLIQAFQVAPGTPLDYYNSNISCIAEKVSQFPGIKSGKDYLLNAKQLINFGQLKFTIDDKIQKVSISGMDFYNMNTFITIMDYEIKQEYYALYQDDFILAFVIGYSGLEQQEVMHKIINKIKFY